MPENMNESRDAPGSPGPGKPNLDLLMIRLAEIRASVPDDYENKKLARLAVEGIMVLTILVIVPLLIGGSCNPAG